MKGKIVEFVTRERLTRVCGIATTPQAFVEILGKLSKPEHTILPSHTDEMLCRSTAKIDFSKKRKPIGTGHKVWAISRQASVYRVVTDERARLLAEANALWVESHKPKEGQKGLDKKGIARARDLFAQARNLTGGPRLVLYLFNAERTPKPKAKDVL